MAVERPQYYENNLEPIAITRDSLLNTLRELRAAVKCGVDLIEKNCPPADQWGPGGYFLGNAGVSLAFLRLAHQAPSLKEDNDTTPHDFRAKSNQRIYPSIDIPLIPSRLSPLGSSSPLAAAVTRTLAAAESGSAVSKDDIKCFQPAIDLALKNDWMVPHQGNNMGGDEILFGRTGLLLSLISIRTHSFDEETQKALEPALEMIPKLVDVIVAGGREGSADYTQKYGEEGALPLMYAWMEGFYAYGSVHGATGILAVLLSCKLEEIQEYLPWIGETITGICKVCIANNGHLPMTIPSRQSPGSNIVQVCHGSPSVLLIMACARRNDRLTSNHWQPEWDEAINLASDRVWEEGLLSKGGGICHGISGNAWPLLYIHDAFQYNVDQMETAKRNYRERTQKPDRSETNGDSGDSFLSKALALLLHARETPPYNTSPKPTSNNYRMPDNPYALTEGLPGTVCAWASACVTIEMRLRQMDLNDQSAATLEKDSLFQELEHRQLGFPTLAYYRPNGVL